MKRLSHYPRRDGPLPSGSVYVGRPHRLGNPYKVTDTTPAPVVVARYRRWLAVQIARQPDLLDCVKGATALACICPPDQVCHVDVILEALAATTPTDKSGDGGEEIA